MCPFSPKFQFYFKKESSKLFPNELADEKSLSWLCPEKRRKSFVHKGLTLSKIIILTFSIQFRC